MTRDGVITSWNPAAAAMFGYQDAEVIGHHVSRFFPDDPVFEDFTGCRPLRPHHTFARHPLADPRRRHHRRSHIGVAFDPADQAGYSVLVRDVTVRKGAEELLRRQALWQTATAEIRLSLLSDASLESSLTLVCKWAVELAGASAAAVVATEDAPVPHSRQGGRP